MSSKNTGWRTIKGNHVFIGSDGVVSKGPAALVGKKLGESKEVSNDKESNFSTFSATNKDVFAETISVMEGRGNTNIIKVNNGAATKQTDTKVSETELEIRLRGLNDSTGNYVNTDTYKHLRNDLQNKGELFDKANIKADKLYKELKDERYTKSKEQWTEEDIFEHEILGSRVLTDEGKIKEKEWLSAFREKDARLNDLTNAQKAMKSLHRKQGRVEAENWNGIETTSVSQNKEFKYFVTKFGSGYDADVQKGRATLVSMKPMDYIKSVAYDLWDTSLYDVIKGRSNDDKVVEYANLMQEGSKAPALMLDYKTRGQEGLHRALAAYLIGAEEIPVIVIR